MVASAAVALAAQTPAPKAAAPKAATPAQTPAKAAPAASAAEAGYTNLFDGRTLTGWKVGGPVETFSVVDGAVQAHGDPGPAHLYYDGPVLGHMFRNFDLKLDVMAKEHSNGGVYIDTAWQDGGFPTKGFEVQVNNSHSDRIRTGSLYHVVDLSYIPAKDGEWFSMEMMQQGMTITIWVKGVKALTWTQPPDWAGSYDFGDRKIQAGTIAFQAHDPGSFTYYKNIRIKALN
jgi:hypothetical protein